MVENLYVGMKSRGCYETPGGIILLKLYKGNVMVVGRYVLLRRHPQGAVEADGLAVEHRVFNDRLDELRVFGWSAEPGRKRHALAERLLHFLR